MGKKDLYKRFIAITQDEIDEHKKTVEHSGSFSTIKTVMLIIEELEEVKRELQMSLNRLEE